MALTIDAKDPQEVRRYLWEPSLADGDDIASYTLVASGITVSSSTNEGTAVEMFISGGTAGAVATIIATAITRDGETIEETLYVPVRVSTVAFTYTARDVVEFALRKITGNGVDADAAEADDALERLNDMLADWRMDGCDIGVPAPLALGTALSIPDEYVSALKFNLRIACHDHYDAPITAYDADRADRGRRNIVNRLTRLNDLGGIAGLSMHRDSVADLF